VTRVVRAALTETRNAYAGMPARREDLDALAPRLDEVRRANLEHHATLIARAASLGARIVGLGEMFGLPYFAVEDRERESWRTLAEDPADGPTARAMCAAARAHGVVVIAPLYERDADTDRRFNTALVVDADGTILGKYRKTHIPHGANERAAFRERFYWEPSDGNLGPMRRNVSGNRFFPVWDTACGRIGVAICYDRHFAGAMATLAREGAEIVFSPAVTFGATSRRMWEHEFATDACRLNVFIAGSNRRGAEPPFDVEYFGESRFVGPQGVVEPLPRRETGDELVVADLDLDLLAAADPSGWSLRKDARPDIYTADAEP
jgi:N-carbamoylputrescine amidase